jgi:hypothetical protein
LSKNIVFQVDFETDNTTEGADEDSKLFFFLFLHLFVFCCSSLTAINALTRTNPFAVIASCKLPPGRYAVIPCTFDPGYETHFTLTIFADKRVFFAGTHCNKLERGGEVCIQYDSPTNDSFFDIV